MSYFVFKINISWKYVALKFLKMVSNFHWNVSSRKSQKSVGWLVCGTFSVAFLDH